MRCPLLVRLLDRPHHRRQQPSRLRLGSIGRFPRRTRSFRQIALKIIPNQQQIRPRFPQPRSPSRTTQFGSQSLAEAVYQQGQQDKAE